MDTVEAHQNDSAFSKRVAVLYDSTGSYQSETINGFLTCMKAAQVSVILVAAKELQVKGFNHTYEKVNEMYNLIQPDQFAGFLILTAQLGRKLSDAQLTDFLTTFRQKPIVGLARPIAGIPTILSDNFQGMSDLMNHLILVRGLKRFVFIQGFQEDPDSKSRLMAFRQSLIQHNLDFDEELLLEGDYSFVKAKKQISSLLHQKRVFDAVVCANDDMALGVIEALHNFGKVVPNDIAVVGFDDIAAAKYSNPPLTTVRQALFEMGMQAGNLLLKQMNQQVVENLTYLKPSLIVRESCGIVKQSIIDVPELSRAGFLKEIQEKSRGLLNTQYQQELFDCWNFFLENPKDNQIFIKFWHKVIQKSNYNFHEIGNLSKVIFFLHDLNAKNNNSYGQKEISLTLFEVQKLIFNLYEHLSSNQKIIQHNKIYDGILHKLSIMSRNTLDELVFELKSYLDFLNFDKFFLVFHNSFESSTYLEAKLILAYSHRTIIYIDKTTFRSTQILPDSLADELTGAFYYQPLYLSDDHYGYILTDAETHELQEVDLLSQEISIALQSVIYSLRLNTAYEGAIRAIGLALEARDQETAGHTDRVANLAIALGTEIQLSADEIRNLRWGAYLHDIGKMNLSDAILYKPSALSYEERLEMMKHVVIGENFAKKIPFLPTEVLNVIRHHHERWDGNGYPDGLSGEEISLGARIFAICDVCDALLSKRPYKPAFSIDQTITELQKGADRGHFDPTLVALFIDRILKNPSYAGVENAMFSANLL